jgi:hypothetical protein
MSGHVGWRSGAWRRGSRRPGSRTTDRSVGNWPVSASQPPRMTTFPRNLLTRVNEWAFAEAPRPRIRVQVCGGASSVLQTSYWTKLLRSSTCSYGELGGGIAVTGNDLQSGLALRSAFGGRSRRLVTACRRSASRRPARVERRRGAQAHRRTLGRWRRSSADSKEVMTCSTRRHASAGRSPSLERSR